MPAALRYPRTARLTRPGDFAALRRDAKRLSGRSFQIEYRVTEHATARLGMAVSRRVSKLAVERNRIRRLVRDSFRLHRAELPPCDVLVIARVAAAAQTAATLRAELQTHWHSLAALKMRDASGKMPAGS